MKRSTGVLCALACVAVGACGDAPPPTIEGVIDRETFIETYVDLRATSVEGPESSLSDEEHDQILARHGVDAESLVAFVDAYGRDLDFMNEVWMEIERRFEALSPADSSGPGAD